MERWSVAAAPVQTPDQDSLVIGVPGESVGAARDGLIHQLATLEFGPITPGSRTLHLGSPGVQGTAGNDNASASPWVIRCGVTQPEPGGS